MSSWLILLGFSLMAPAFAQDSPDGETQAEIPEPSKKDVLSEDSESTASSEPSGEKASSRSSEVAKPDRVTVLHVDESPEVVGQHVSLVAGVPSDAVDVLTLATFLRGLKTSVTGNATASACSGAASTMANIKDAIERSRGAIDLMEDNKAMAYISTAVEGISCLGETLNGENASELYFLKGFLEYSAGEEGKARESFRRVHQLQSGLGWDNYFPPEAEPLFNEMAEAVAAAKTANVTVVPTPVAGSVWLDGNPVSMIGSQLRVPVGKHVLQFVGDRVMTYEFEVSSSGDVELTVPSLLSSTSVDWVASAEQSKGYSAVLSSAFPAGETVYVSYEGSIWATTIGSGTWSELVAKGAADQAEILRSERFARAPKVSGTVLTSAGAVLTVVGAVALPMTIDAYAKYGVQREAYRSAKGDPSFDPLTPMYDALGEQAQRAYATMSITGVGLSLGALGLGFGVSHLKKARLRRAELPPWHPYAVDLVEEEAAE